MRSCSMTISSSKYGAPRRSSTSAAARNGSQPLVSGSMTATSAASPTPRSPLAVTGCCWGGSSSSRMSVTNRCGCTSPRSPTGDPHRRHLRRRAADDAFDELDRQWVELGGPARVVDLTHRYCNIFGRGTFVELNELIAPGFVAIDHRPLGLGVRNREAWLESIREFVGNTDVILTEYLRVRDRHVLTRGSFVLHTDGSVLVDGLVLTGYTDDGQFDLMELFAADQLESAHQRLDELRELDERAATLLARPRTGERGMAYRQRGQRRCRTRGSAPARSTPPRAVGVPSA